MRLLVDADATARTITWGTRITADASTTEVAISSTRVFEFVSISGEWYLISDSGDQTTA